MINLYELCLDNMQENKKDPQAFFIFDSID